MANQLLSMAGWYILPNLVTGYLQPILYTIFIRAGDPKPLAGTPRFNRDRRNIQIFVIAVYLLYTIYEADYQLRRAGDFYAALGVPHGATDREIQSRFRRLTVQFHPDKVSHSGSSSPGEKAAVEAVYVQLKLARDTLTEPAKRFAYDRFGPDMLGWRGCKTVQDFVYAGVQRTTGYYVASGVVLIGLGMMGYLQHGKFWRYTVMASLFLVEVTAMSRPHFPWLLTSVVNPVLVATGLRPPYLPFQMLSLLRKLALTFFIAIAQLGPLLQDPRTAAALQDADKIPEQHLARLDALAQQSDAELARLMGLELAPFASEAAAIRDLKTSVKEWLVQNTIRNDPEVRRAVGAVLDRRRREGQLPSDSGQIHQQ